MYLIAGALATTVAILHFLQLYPQTFYKFRVLIEKIGRFVGILLQII